MRTGLSKIDTYIGTTVLIAMLVVLLAAICSSRLCLDRPFLARKPSTVKRSVARPEATSAASIADGPGIGTTR